MVNPETEVLFYRTRAGRVPFDEWLSALRDPRARAKVRARIGRLRLGYFGDCKAVGEGVSELRVHYGPGYRIYFGKQGRAVVVLLCAGDKGNQSRNIARAKRYWREHSNVNDSLS